MVQLSARGATVGVARFCRHSDPVAFDDEDLILAQEIAARAAVAIDRARRYARRSHGVRRNGPPYAVSCRYLPAGAQAGVGGDWYDVIPLSGAGSPWPWATWSTTASTPPPRRGACGPRSAPSPRVSGDGTVDRFDPPLGLGGLPFEAAEADLPEGGLPAL
ncbi:hypothetical protein SMA5143A_3494 [Streptomyces sp. MA5143a]|nr:hypothetical protein SMA5143A_3494 [Streptomyces sp. MA5143a]